MTFDTRLAAYVLWGFGTVLVWGVVLFRRGRAHRHLRNRRTRTDLVSAIALFITALCSLLAITAVFFGPIGDFRGFFVSVALGAFFAAGVVRVSEGNLVERN